MKEPKPMVDEGRPVAKLSMTITHDTLLCSSELGTMSIGQMVDKHLEDAGKGGTVDKVVVDFHV